jgi:hypothetical protein
LIGKKKNHPQIMVVNWDQLRKEDGGIKEESKHEEHPLE